MLYVVGIVLYFGVMVELLYAWLGRKSGAMAKLKAKEKDDIGVGGHLNKLRIFIKATLLSVAHFGPLYFISALFCIDLALILLDYHLTNP